MHIIFFLHSLKSFFLKGDTLYLHEHDTLKIKSFYFVDGSNLCFVIPHTVLWPVEKLCGELVGPFLWILKRAANKPRRLI